jgi:hypothetical protein
LGGEGTCCRQPLTRQRSYKRDQNPDSFGFDKKRRERKKIGKTKERKENRRIELEKD